MSDTGNLKFVLPTRAEVAEQLREAADRLLGDEDAVNWLTVVHAGRAISHAVHLGLEAAAAAADAESDNFENAIVDLAVAIPLKLYRRDGTEVLL